VTIRYRHLKILLLSSFELLTQASIMTALLRLPEEIAYLIIDEIICAFWEHHTVLRPGLQLCLDLYSLSLSCKTLQRVASDTLAQNACFYLTKHSYRLWEGSFVGHPDTYVCRLMLEYGLRNANRNNIRYEETISSRIQCNLLPS